MGFHSPTSQYGQLSRRGYFDHLDMKTRMGEITENITNRKFADEWDAEAASGHEKLGALLEQHAGPSLGAFEMDMRNKIGVGVLDEDPDRNERD